VNNFYATRTSNGRVFCMGDAIHRHPPSNGLGSNTSIQDSFNLAWKLAMVLKGQAGEALLDSYNTERAPIAKQIVTRANQSIGETGPIFAALGMTEGVDPVQMQKNLEARSDGTAAAEAQREAIRKAIAFKKYEFDAHGVEMNQRYRSDAIVTDGQIEPAFELDSDLHYQPTTWPGARLPHAWVYDRETGAETSTLDLCGHGSFTLLTGLGGEAWVAAAEAVAANLGIRLVSHIIGPRRPFVDHHGDWARVREVKDSGCVLVRPDHHVAWRAELVSADAKADLDRVLRAILAR
jgi:2,4-dichlorophenol 6-monooxygenase